MNYLADFVIFNECPDEMIVTLDSLFLLFITGLCAEEESS